MGERCEQTSERRSEWPSTQRVDFKCFLPIVLRDERMPYLAINTSSRAFIFFKEFFRFSFVEKFDKIRIKPIKQILESKKESSWQNLKTYDYELSLCDVKISSWKDVQKKFSEMLSVLSVSAVPICPEENRAILLFFLYASSVSFHRTFQYKNYEQAIFPHVHLK